MIKIGDNYYNWSDTAIRSIAKRLLSGDELTINYHKYEAWINYYIGKDAEKISWDYAEMIVKLGILDCHSGNWRTGEYHYNIN